MQIIGYGLTELHCELKKKWIYFMCVVCYTCVPVEVMKMVSDPWTCVEVEGESGLHRAVF